MKICVDTNVLVRAVVQDDPEQGKAAAEALRSAELIVVTLPTLCEFVWVLRRVYSFRAEEIAAAMKALLQIPSVAANRTAAAAGVEMLLRSGDFADGVIAFEGRWLGGESFVSFDRQAIRLLREQGFTAEEPATA